ncbi:membrane protein [Streptomyces phage Zuko]|uniref:Membrane protein n=1 Tax=Streptomyces phage Zuko TaxID=2601695 RepID=A0A5J6D761_9CAUD|nr:membrane protein [Streptomyces phage Zuko]QEQ93639.1 membrane protein [Streptomyces phage Zuko]
MTLEDWDRPELQCRDESCRAYQAGIPHTTDESHREVLAVLRDMRATPTYGNQEFGHRAKDERRPYLSPAYKAMLDAQERKPDRVHWVWFFLAAVLVIGPLEFWAVWLMWQ